MELDSAVDGGNDAVQTIDFTDDFSMNAGETLNLAVTADIASGAASGTAFGAKFVRSGLVTEDGNGDALATSDIIPGTDITGYNQVARAASLAFALASTPSSTTTVDGTQNVSVVGFTVTAGLASPVTVTDLTLSAYGEDTAVGGTYTIGGGAPDTNADVNDYVDSCSLYDGATRVAGPEAPATNGQTIRFNSMSWTIAAGGVKNLTVQCNFANTSTAGNAYFSFDIATVLTDVVAEDSSSNAIDVTGDAANGGVTPTRTVTLADSGTLAVTVASGTPSADFILTGTNNAEVAEYRFTATNESFNVTTLEFKEFAAQNDGIGADSSAYANNISLVTLSYPKADGTMGTATASMSANAATFTGLTMYVPVGTPKDVKVYVNTPASDRNSGGSATSNEKIRMTFSNGDGSGTESFKATGAGSGYTLDESTKSDITTGVPAFVVRETKPVITLSASSPSGSVVAGRIEALRFNVAASANQDVVLNTLTFKMTSTDNAGTPTLWNGCDTNGVSQTLTSDFDFYDLKDASTTLDTADTDWTFLKATGAVCDTAAASLGFVKITLPVASIVTKGTSHSYALYFDATGASSSSDDSLRFDLPTDPIANTYLVDQAYVVAVTAVNTDFTAAAAGGYTLGDVICVDADASGVCDAAEEKVLVVVDGGTALTVVRGYLGSTPAADAAGNFLRMPGSLLWQDDGSSTVALPLQEYWSSSLVDNLPVTGGTLVF